MFAVYKIYPNSFELRRIPEDITIKKDNPNLVETFKELSDIPLDYQFSYIVWDRINVPELKLNEKIKVPFSYSESIEELQKVSNEIKLQKEALYKEKVNAINNAREKKASAVLHEHHQKVKESDDVFIDSNDDFTAMKNWKKSGYIMPPPSHITAIKKKYFITWDKFKEICENL